MHDSRSHRCFQLSLKSLFLLTLLVATFFAGYSLRGKQDEAGLRRGEQAQQREEQAQQALEQLQMNGDGTMEEALARLRAALESHERQMARVSAQAGTKAP